jgi:hypothetical protein
MGTNIDMASSYVGWIGATGAAPGIVADMWLEFWWFSLAALFMIGVTYNRIWAKAVQSGGLWIIVYIVASILSVYLVMQTLEAMLFRFLFIVIPMWLIFKLARYRISY